MKLNSSPFSLVKKRVFSFAKYPQSPHSMLGYNRIIITCTNINFLLNMGHGGGGSGEERKKEVKSSSLPNSFDDDCSMCTDEISLSKHFTPKILIANCRYVQSQDIGNPNDCLLFLLLGNVRVH